MFSGEVNHLSLYFVFYFRKQLMISVGVCVSDVLIMVSMAAFTAGKSHPNSVVIFPHVIHISCFYYSLKVTNPIF